MNILMIEDDRELCSAVSFRLEQEGFSVTLCHDGEEGLYYMQETPYDLVILDRMLPHMNGIEVLKEARSRQIKTPVIILTALGELNDRLTGLNCGADDYMVKPFAFEELLARIRVMIRRGVPCESSGEVNVLEAADLKVDTKSHQVWRGGQQIELSSREYAVLEYLMRNQGIVLSRRAIEEHVWSYDYMGGSNMIDVYIRYLRKKLDDGFEEKLIHTVRGSGYVLRRDS